MAVEFRITRGARAGARERFEKSVITIGRHPMNDLRFDAAKDLDVSSRHAELRSVGDHHVLHDLGSTNGTFVNGSRVTGERELRQGDIVGFGPDGPQMIFHIPSEVDATLGSASAARVEIPRASSTVVPALPEPPVATPAVPAAAWAPFRPGQQRPHARTHASPPSPPEASPEASQALQVPKQSSAAAAPAPRAPTQPAAPAPPVSPAPAAQSPAPARGAGTRAPNPALAATIGPNAAPMRPRRNTEVRIAEAVQMQTGKLRLMVIGLGVAVVLVGGAAAWFTLQATASAKQQAAALIAANDSVIKSLETRLAQTGLAEAALRAALADNARLSRQIRDRRASGEDVSALSEELRATQSRTASIARMDYSAVTAANKAAVVFLAVEMPDGTSSSGSGFNILPGGLIVTNRHVVQTRGGQRAQRVAVAFDDTQGEWKIATIEYVSETDELALLRLTRQGNYPVVTGIAGDANAVKLGDPVAILGYPLGTSTAGMDQGIDNLRPIASLGIGTVSKTLPENVQLDAYAAQGSSGSPVFDARGLVVGVLFGAAAESGGRIIYTVPSARLAAQLPKDAAGVIR